MKELLKEYATYNLWANQKLSALVLVLPEEKQVEEIISSFNSLQKTILHLWDAESIWWQRMKLSEKIIRPSENFKGATKDAVEGLLHQSHQWEVWVKDASERMIEHVFQYQDSRKQLHKNPIYQMLLHVFNHGTYHRGQIVTMLRQLGVEKIPSTDFIGWCRI